MDKTGRIAATGAMCLLGLGLLGSCGKKGNGVGPGPILPVVKDTIPPVINSISVPRYTNIRNPEVTNSVTGADSMKSYEKGSNVNFKAYNGLDTLILSAPEGQKSLYFVFKDTAGNTAKDSGVINLKTTAPSVPAGFKDTITNDPAVNFGVFSLDGLVREFYKTPTDSGSLANINNKIYQEGATPVYILLEDSAGNITKDTAEVIAAMLDSLGIKPLVTNFYSGKGDSLVDSLKQYTVTDSLYRSYALKFDYVFKAGNNHIIRVDNNPLPDSIMAAVDYTTGLNKTYGMPERFLALSKDWATPVREKLLNFYDNHKQ